MKLFKKLIPAGAAALLAVGFAACEDACDYDDVRTDNPSWVKDYTDTLTIAHPDSLTGWVWVRGEGIKYNAYGEEIQGYVESIEFFSKDSCIVTQSQGTTAGTMGADDTNTRENPYKYYYTNVTGTLNIVKTVTNDKGILSEVTLISGTAVSGTKYGDLLTVCHFGDTPAQTYLVRGHESEENK